MEPIRPIDRSDGPLSAVTRVTNARVRHETPDEAHERRQREARERARKQAARAWADAQLQSVQAQQEVVSEDDSDDGRPHVDIRI